MMRDIKVVIADDHPIVLLGLSQIVNFNDRFEVVAEAKSSSELIEQLQNHSPDLIITDFNMPGDLRYGDGFKLVEYIARHHSEVKIIVLTMVSNVLVLDRLTDFGVFDVIQKSSLQEKVGSALESYVAQRDCKIINGEHCVTKYSSQQVDDRFATLSTREIEVLRLFVGGNRVTDIAKLLGRSSKTISSQKNTAMRKLKIITDQELFTYCIKSGYFE